MGGFYQRHASSAKQSIAQQAESWIARRKLLAMTAVTS
jgi:hypothetical protein